MASNDPHTRDWITVKHPDSGLTTEIPQSSLESFKRRGWEPLADTTPDRKANLAELREWATQKDPDNAEAIAAMTKADIRAQYGA